VATEDRKDVFDKKQRGRTGCNRCEETRYYKTLYYTDFLNLNSSPIIFNTINHKMAVSSRHDRYEKLIKNNAVKLLWEEGTW